MQDDTNPKAQSLSDGTKTTVEATAEMVFKRELSGDIKTTVEATAETVFKREHAKLQKELDDVNKLMIGVIIVLGLGFLGLLFALAAIMYDGWAFHSSVYQEYLQKFDEDRKSRDSADLQEMRRAIDLLKKKDERLIERLKDRTLEK